MDWISVDDEMPPNLEYVQVMRVYPGKHRYWNWTWHVRYGKNHEGVVALEPTHWRPLNADPLPFTEPIDGVDLEGNDA